VRRHPPARVPRRASELSGARSYAHPRFAANNLIDEASFTAADLRKLTRGIPRAIPENAQFADYAYGECPQGG